jgi:formyl-CoA transferase
MMDTAMMMQAAQMSAYLVNGTLPDLMGNRSPTKQPTANVFATANGFIQVVALRETQIRALFKLLDQEAFYDAHQDPVDRVRHTAEFNSILEPAMAADTTENWLAKLDAAGVPAAPIRNLAQTAVDEQMAHRLCFTDIPHPTRKGETTRVVSAGHMASPAPPAVQGPPPRLGEHTDEILQSVGYSDAQRQALYAAGVAQPPGVPN